MKKQKIWQGRSPRTCEMTGKAIANEFIYGEVNDESGGQGRAVMHPDAWETHGKGAMDRYVRIGEFKWKKAA